jgi:hypothetical protein
MTLSNEDLKRIEAIEDYLKNLSTHLPYTVCINKFSSYQPIDTTEGEQEHAEQEAIEFAELLNENFVYVHNGLYRHVATLQDYTITQIYQQFKQRN